MSLMEMLYDGCLAPGEQVVPKSKKYKEAVNATADLMESLEKEWDREDYDKIEQLLDLKAEEYDLMNKECFRYGVAMGVLLMQEIYQVDYFHKQQEG